MKKQWWKESVVYQIYPRSFNDSNGDGVGDIKGITQKLEYLKELGIDVIWLSPIFQSPNDDNGYDISDYRAIMDEFGTMEDFDEMLDKAHSLGIKVMLDLVVNHTSDEHSWFIESSSSNENPYHDYYIWRPGRKNNEPPTNWKAAFGGSAWKYHKKTDEYYLHLFSEKQPDLNWENPILRQEIYDLMTYWLNKGVNGFRMDVINFISKNQDYPEGNIDNSGYGDGSPYYMNGPRVHEFLQEMHKQVLSNFDTITVGEMPGATVEDAKLYTGENRNELNMIFHFEHVDLGNDKFGKWQPESWKLTDLKRIFSKWQQGLEQDGWNSLYWSNHDQPRVISRFGDDRKCYRELSGKMLATCLHMLKGTPFIYQGEEIGMTNVSFSDIKSYRDIETLNAYHDYTKSGLLTPNQIMNGIYERGRDNARTPMQWSDNKQADFTSGTPWINVNSNYKEINVKKALRNKNSIFYYYKNLIYLRKQHPVIVYGKYDLLLKEDEQIYAYTRSLSKEKILVICNFTEREARFCLPKFVSFEQKELLISNYEVDITQDITHFMLNSYEARVYLLK